MNVLALALLPLFLSTQPGSFPEVSKESFDSMSRFDSLNRLRWLRHNDGSSKWIARDIAGRAQAETTVNLLGHVQSTATHRYDGYRRIHSSEGKRFLYGRSLDEMLFQESGAEQLSPIVSQLGSTQKLVNGAGAILQQFKYDAFGAPIAGDTKVFSQLFAGAHYDNKAKLYDLRNRHYDPRIGRFLSRDPIGMHTDAANMGNAYAYVGNNPLNRRDPLGLMGDDNTNNPAPQIPNYHFNVALRDGIGRTHYVPLDQLHLYVSTSADVRPPSPIIDGIENVAIGGIALCFGPEGWLAYAAYASLCADGIQAGARQAWTGERTSTLVQTTFDAIGEKAQLSPRGKELYTMSSTMALWFLAGGGLKGLLESGGGGGEGALALAKGGTALAPAIAFETGSSIAAAFPANSLVGALLMTGNGGEGPSTAKTCPKARAKGDGGFSNSGLPEKGPAKNRITDDAVGSETGAGGTGGNPPDLPSLLPGGDDESLHRILQSFLDHGPKPSVPWQNAADGWELWLMLKSVRDQIGIVHGYFSRQEMDAFFETIMKFRTRRFPPGAIPPPPP